ncbi:hypothetical protein JHK87_045494 [Glycine soja]|nr:hypothetical protein JHK87_045494 [Glycine soja]
MSYTISSQELSLKAVLEVLSFRGAIFLLLCTYNVSKYEDNDGENEECLYAPLSDQLNEVDPISHHDMTKYKNRILRGTVWSEELKESKRQRLLTKSELQREAPKKMEEFWSMICGDSVCSETLFDIGP